LTAVVGMIATNVIKPGIQGVLSRVNNRTLNTVLERRSGSDRAAVLSGRFLQMGNPNQRAWWSSGMIVASGRKIEKLANLLLALKGAQEA